MFSKNFFILTLIGLLLFALNIVVHSSGFDEKPLLHPLFADQAALP
jgi:hypothetical protein